MVKILDPVAEKIEIVDQPDEETERKGFKLWLVAPLMLVVAAVSTFFLLRRSKNADKDF